MVSICTHNKMANICKNIKKKKTKTKNQTPTCTEHFPAGIWTSYRILLALPTPPLKPPSASTSLPTLNTIP